ncbi:MAG TPA: B-4DMT family transporter [Mycobacterium sp.]|nr:B-4DMT family transporter [Mycobacterium sp.]
MTNWLQRGLAFAAAMVVLRLIQGVLINAWESQAGLISLALLAGFVIGVTYWGVSDGRDDASANPDPDRRRDLAMTWLLAGLVAGIVSGAVAWLISLFDGALYVGGLLNELTTFAAFTALVVFVPAMGGVVLGRWLVDRGYAKVPQRHHGLAAQDAQRVDTDVFAAVSAGGAPATATAAPVADWPTEEFPVATEESPTGEIPTQAETEQAPVEAAGSPAEAADTGETTGAIPTEDESHGDQNH